jgi:two-component system, NtrC family, nitrogen regulation sensor histidine kinase NtrY
VKRLNHERQVLLLALMAGLPGSLTALALLWYMDLSSKLQWTLTVLILWIWLGFAFAVRSRVVFPLRTLSNLLAALREGDFSIRARVPGPEDALGELTTEVNALAGTLRQQRLGAVEATALLSKVMEQIDVAVFAFNPEHRLRLVNRAGERLVGQADGRELLGYSAKDLGLEECLAAETVRNVDMSFAGGTGRWQIRRSTIREGGLPHEMLVISDLSRALREEERQAWRRLIRVLGHELNNSLAPIKSVADSLATLLSRQNLPSDWREDTQRGLEVIGARADALGRFTSSYARWTKLPPPKMAPTEIGVWVRRVVGLETRVAVHLAAGEDVTLQADSDQLDQLLINLLKNAAEASQETGGSVTVRWKKEGEFVELRVEDEGPGLPNTGNLFVPFFTTKPGGSGIGLVLSREIAEGHGGSLTLENRTDARGCVARVLLPIPNGSGQ